MDLLVGPHEGLLGDVLGQGPVAHDDPNGYATDYYHLARNIAKPQGAPIGAGDYLGVTGTDVSCGGSASGRHVHFALRRGGNYVAVDDRSLEGWTFQQGTAYNGYAERSGVIRRPVSPLRNYRP